MFQVGFGECIVVLLVAILAFGPEQLPTVARLAGESLGKMKKKLIDLKKEFDDAKPR